MNGGFSGLIHPALAIKPGDSTASGAINVYSQGWPLLDASKGDSLWVLDLQSRTASTGYQYQALTRAAQVTNATFTDGGNAAVTAALAESAAQLVTQRVKFMGSQFYSHLGEVSPSAQPSSSNTNFLAVDAQPGFASKGAFLATGSPDLFIAAPQVAADADFGFVSWLNPFPAGYDVFVVYSSGFRVGYSLPGSSVLYGTTSIGGQDVTANVDLTSVVPKMT